MAKTEAPRGSFLPQDAQEGGGAIPSGPGTIESIRFVHFDYKERDVTDDKEEAFGLMVMFQSDDKEAHEGEPYNQFYSAGKDRQATDDGASFTGKPGLPKNSKAMAFIASLIEAGFDKLEDDISVADGTRVILVEKACPKYGNDSDAKNKTYALVDSLITDKAASKKPASNSKAEKSPTSTGKATPVKKDDSAVAAQEFIVEQLEKAKSALTRKKLSQLAFKEITDKDLRKIVIEKIGDDDFMGSDSAPWNFDGSEAELS